MRSALLRCALLTSMGGLAPPHAPRGGTPPRVVRRRRFAPSPSRRAPSRLVASLLAGLASLASTALLTACFDGHVSIGDLPPCGHVTCDLGESCCDSTCGLCSVGGSCPAIGCGEPCGG